MSKRDEYKPGAAAGAEVKKDGEQWTLVVVRELRHSPENLRWTLEARGEGTRLTLWHNIDRGFIAMGAAGWHICLDVLDRLIAEEPIGRIVGGEAMKFDWPRLNDEYAKQFGL